MAENEFRKTFAQILGGFLVLLGLAATSRQVTTATEQLRLAEERQTAERFSKAIEHLGDNSQTIRLGGIYALGRVGQDATDTYRTGVLEILSAFIRDKYYGVAEDEIPYGTDTELQAAATVVRDVTESKDPPVPLNLSGSRLDGLNLKGFRFGGGDLSRISMYATDCRACQLDGANLSNAVLAGADLRGANLRDATLTDAYLGGRFRSHMGFEFSYDDVREPWWELIVGWESDSHVALGDLRGADLSGAKGLTQAMVNQACLDSDTLLPPELKALRPCPTRVIEDIRRHGHVHDILDLLDQSAPNQPNSAND